MSRNIAVLSVIVSLSILPFAYAQDKPVNPAENRPSIFSTDEADQPVEKEAKRSKRWYPFVKDKKWYPYVGESGAPETTQESAGQQWQGELAPSK